MAFDPTAAVNDRWHQDGAELRVTWETTTPAGTAYQVYLDSVFAWHGKSPAASTTMTTLLPLPHPAAGRFRVDIGSVAPGEESVDLSRTLAAAAGGGDRVKLPWLGGTFESDDIAGFRVYQGAGPGLAVNYAAAVATVAAYPGGLVSDGFGVGGFGLGGFGRSANAYSWTSGHLASGVWNFAVRAFDAWGNEVNGCTSSATVVTPPKPPAADAGGHRLTYTFDAPSRVATLHWLASPG